MGRPGDVLAAFTKLGLTSFGGPTAHLGYFREEWVTRRGWVDDTMLRRLIAVASLLPGPTSSQVGFALGWVHAGWRGAIAAFVGFTLPSALVMAGAALLPLEAGPLVPVVAALRLLAVAVVSQAVVAMARGLPARASRRGAALVGFVVALLAPPAVATAGSVLLGAVIGALDRSPQPATAAPSARVVSPRLAVTLASVAAAGFALTPLTANGPPLVRALGVLYRTGALVFGGGHIILPLLREGIVGGGLLPDATFLAGYGLAQAMPGPLSSFGAYIGMAVGGPLGAVLGLLALYAPGLLLVPLGLTLLDRAGAVARLTGPLEGAGSAVVGVLAAAAVMLARESVRLEVFDIALVVGLFLGLTLTRRPPWQWVAVALLVGLARAA